jgi:hypothetical protein
MEFAMNNEEFALMIGDSIRIPSACRPSSRDDLRQESICVTLEALECVDCGPWESTGELCRLVAMIAKGSDIGDISDEVCRIAWNRLRAMSASPLEKSVSPSRLRIAVDCREDAIVGVDALNDALPTFAGLSRQYVEWLASDAPQSQVSEWSGYSKTTVATHRRRLAIALLASGAQLSGQV